MCLAQALQEGHRMLAGKLSASQQGIRSTTAQWAALQSEPEAQNVLEETGERGNWACSAWRRGA